MYCAGDRRQCSPLFVSLNMNRHMVPFSWSEEHSLHLHTDCTRTGHLPLGERRTYGNQRYRDWVTAGPPHQQRAVSNRGLLLPSKWHVHWSACGKPHSLKFLCSVFDSSGFLFKFVEGQVWVSLVCDELSVPFNLNTISSPENLYCGCSKRSE